MEIRDNVFLITGGASGLGAATARLFAEHGGKVVLADMNEDAGEALAKELGGVFVKCDVSREDDGQQAVEAATQARHACAGSSTARASRLPSRPSARTARIRSTLFTQDDLDQSDRHLQHDPARGRGNVEERAERGGRARRDREHGIGGGIRRPDRPGGVCGIEERRGGHDAADRPRSVAQRASA